MDEALSLLEEFVASTRAAAHEIVTAATAALATTPRPCRADLVEIEPLLTRILGEREETIHGGGFVAAPGLLVDAPWWLEWFGWDAGGLQRLVSETNPAAAHFFDYTYMPWYAGPRDRPPPGRALTGPYVDYLCTDDYTLTFTEAVRREDDSFAGVAGVDVRISALEERVLVTLRDSGRVLVLVNELGRVTVSATAQLLSGDLVEDLDIPAMFEAGDERLTRIADSELGLLDLGPR